MVRGVIKNYLMKIHGQVRITVKTNQSKLYVVLANVSLK